MREELNVYQLGCGLFCGNTPVLVDARFESHILTRTDDFVACANIFQRVEVMF